jgi:hypothetical protein
VGGVSKRLRRWGMVDAFLYLLAAAMVVGLLQGVVAFAEIALEDPLFVAGYLALVGVVAVPYRFAARAWRARPPRRPRWSWSRLWPSWVPKDITDGLLLSAGGVLFGGGGPLMVADGLDRGFGGFPHIVIGSMTALFGLACVAGLVRHLYTWGRRRQSTRMESTQDPGPALRRAHRPPRRRGPA